ncbi:MAG: DUF4390 domain-containing protein [Gammaproteobacteria bacterium]
MLVALCLTVGLSGLIAGPAVAADGDGYLAVRSAYAEIRSGVYYLDALIDIELNEEAGEALTKGVSLAFELQIEVQRKRRFWLDKLHADLKQRYELHYHALSQRYIVRNTNTGEQQGFTALDAALASLGDISSLPIIDETLIEPDETYEIRIRAVLDNKSIPGALRLFFNWFVDWRMTSEWLAWQLSP